MRLTISKKIIFIAILGVATTGILILFISMVMMRSRYAQIIHNDITAIQSMVARMQIQEEERLQRYAYLLTTMPELVDAVSAQDEKTIKDILEVSLYQLGLDAIAVTNTHGVVLARGSFDLAGDDISGRPEVSAALGGETVSGIVFQQAALLPYCIRIYTPIYSGNTQVGVLVMGLDIGTEAYVDAFKNITGMEFSLYKDDIRIMTTIKEEDGSRTINNRLNNDEVLDSVLNRKEITVKRLDIYGEPYSAVFWPIIDFNGDVVGMWFIGASLAEHIAEENRFMVVIILASLGVALFSSLLAGLLGVRIAKPIRRIISYAAQVAGGNYEAPLSVSGHDEIGQLVNALRTMVTALKECIVLNELQLTKMHLMVKATKIGLWDINYAYNDTTEPKVTVTWSNEFRQMLGYTDFFDFPNTLESWTDCIHPEDKDKIVEGLQKHIKDTSGKTPFDYEYRMKKKNNEWAYFRDTGETIRDEKGNPLYIAGALIDVAEMKNLIYEAEEQRLAAEDASRAKTAFLANMSHEIRTPMNAILGITEIQLQRDSLDAETRVAIEKIYTSGDLLLGIINDILDLSKIEAGKLELFTDKYEIASLVSDTVQLNLMRVGSKRISFELHIDEHVPAILSGDELRVKQIMNNLLSNAFKYTSEGTVNLTIKAIEPDDPEIARDKVVLIIIVSDTGQGMTEEHVKKLFDEYSRFNVETNRSTEGTGLGMSITKKLVDLMDGAINVQSKKGVGSAFTVHLPQNRVNGEVLGKEMIENLRLFRVNNTAQMRRTQITRDAMPYGNVLVVDDVETNIYVAKGLLMPYELKISSATSGYAAIEKIKAGNIYDIIFMDHMMPELDGIETTKRIRELGYNHPIVALTANAVSGQADIFLGNGFDDFISKPIDLRQMNMLLNKIIRDKQPPEVIEKARKEAAERKEQNILPQNTNDPEFVRVFIREVEKSLTALEELLEKESWYHHEDDMRVYIIHIHTIKTSLANIGKLDFSAVALKLEQAARNRIFEIVLPETPLFFRTIREFLEGFKKADAVRIQIQSIFLNKEIDGINLVKGFELMNNDEAAYLQILRSYTDNVRTLLASVKDFDETHFGKYKIAVHGIKGASAYIFADPVGQQAEALEKAAEAGDMDYIRKHNPAFLDIAWKLVNDLEEMLAIYKNKNTKLMKPEPEITTLKKILDACKRFDMDDLDAAMEEIERYQYDSDDGLADWLREAINNMELTKAAEKLAYLEVD
jgi:signal transduction histidine kinase/CheY-like chemotaxis protein/HAMP domain-containing protein